MTGERTPERRETEEAARSGRFPDDDGQLRDDSTPVEPERPSWERASHPLEEEQPGVVSAARSRHSHDTNPGQSGGEFDEGVATEHLRSPSQGARPSD
jgi:hypothetical protein